MKFRITIFLFCILISGFCFQTAAHAACFNPPGNAGDLNYNGGYRTFEYCDGGTWVRTGGAGDTRTGLVGWWKFDDGSGTSAADSSGSGNTGTTQNSPTWTTSGMNGGALTLNGTTQYVSVPDAASLNLSGSWTLAAWVNLSALPGSGHVYDIINRWTATYNNSYEIVIDNNDDCSGLGWRVQFSDASSNNYNACYVTSINTGTWYHIAGVWDSSTSNLYLYLNGALVGTQNESGHVPATGAGLPLILGDDGNGQVRYLNGTVDDARVYNRALTANDIKTLYTSTGGTSGDINSNLVGWWKLDDGTSGSTPATAVDSSGNNSTGTLSGTTLPTWTTSGKIGNALVFANASNNYVDVANPANFAFDRTNPFTLSAWVYRTSATTEGDIIAKMTNATGWPGYDLSFPANGQTGNCASDACTTNCLQMSLNTTTSGNNACIIVENSAATTNAWHHIVATYDGSSTAAGIHIYVDGALQTPTYNASNITSSILISTDLKIGTNGSGYGNSFTGTIDDVRVYSRTLSPADVLTLYNTTATACAGPVGYTGDLMYNAGTYHVPQFCNGTNWIPVGPVSPVGAGGGGCSSPAGSEGDVRFSSSTSRAMTYCDGTHWHAMGNIPISGLVAWWNLDEGSGTTAADSSGNGNTGTLQSFGSLPTWTNGHSGNAVYFDNGAPDNNQSSIGFSDTGHPELDIGGSWTVSTWIKMGSLPAATTSGEMLGRSDNYFLVVDNGDWHYDSTTELGWVTCFANVPAYGSSQFCDKNVTAISTGTWYLITGVYDSVAQTLKTYVNGVADAGTSVAGYVPGSYAGDGSVGGYAAGVNYTLDDARVYNRALSASEVWRLYNGTP